MGVNIQAWRAAIGRFTPRVHYTGPGQVKPTLSDLLRPLSDPTTAIFLCLLLLLAGDVELNPGPVFGASSRQEDMEVAGNQENWEFVETLKLTQSYILREFSIDCQVEELALNLFSDLDTNRECFRYISELSYRRVTQTENPVDKMDTIISSIIAANHDHMEPAFHYLLKKISEFGRPDISKFLTEKWQSLKNSPRQNNWTYITALRKCDLFIKENFAIRPQVEDLASSLYTECGDDGPLRYISDVQYRHIRVTQVIEDKLNLILKYLVEKNSDKMQPPFMFLVKTMRETGHGDIADVLTETLREVEQQPRPVMQDEASVIEGVMQQMMEMAQRLGMIGDFTRQRKAATERPSGQREDAQMTTTLGDGDGDGSQARQSARHDTGNTTQESGLLSAGSVLLEDVCDSAEPGNLGVANMGIAHLEPNLSGKDRSNVGEITKSISDVTVEASISTHVQEMSIHVGSSGQVEHIGQINTTETPSDDLNIAGDTPDLVYSKITKFCEKGDSASVEQIISQTSDSGNAILHQTCRDGDVRVVKELLGCGLVGVNGRDEKGRTPLMIAMLYRHVGVIGALLDSGKVTLAATDNDGFGYLPYMFGEEVLEQLYLLSLISTHMVKILKEDYTFEIDIATHIASFRDIQKTLNWNEIVPIVECLVGKDINHDDLLKNCLTIGNDVTVLKVLESGKVQYRTKDSIGYSYSVVTTINPGILKVLVDYDMVNIEKLPLHQMNSILESVARYNNSELSAQTLKYVRDLKVNRSLKTLLSIQVIPPTALNSVLDMCPSSLLYTGGFNMNSKDEGGNTAFMLCCKWASYETVCELMGRKDIKYNIRNRNGQSCLMLALMNNDKRIASLLLGRPDLFPISIQDNSKKSTLFYAVMCGNIDAVKMISVDNAISINDCDTTVRTALHRATIRGMMFLHNVENEDEDLTTEPKLASLLRKIKIENTEMVLSIIDSGKRVNVNDADCKGWTALMGACRYGTGEMVAGLLRIPGIDVNAANTVGWTALMYGCRYGTPDMVGRLLSVPGIDVNGATTDGWTALMMACRYGTPDMVGQLLCVPGIDVNAADTDGWTALMFACRYGSADMVGRLLCVPGIDVNAAGTDGLTALMNGCRYGTPDMVGQLLCVPGIDVNAADTDGWTALIYGCRYGTPDMVGQLLCVPGIDVNAADTDGWTALMYGCRCGTPDMVGRLLEVPGIAVNAANTDGWTALMNTCRFGTDDMVAALLHVDGGNINATTPDGVTALMAACLAGNSKTVALLLQHNADITLITVVGNKAVDFAERGGHYDIAAMLSSHTAVTDA